MLFLVPDLPYRDCTIENISDVSHDTKLYSLALPPGCRMCVPLGYHVHIRHTVEGMLTLYTRMCVPLGYHVHIRHTVEGIYIFLLHSYKYQMIKTGG